MAKKTVDGREVPVIPPLPLIEPNPEPNPVVAVCGECDMEIRRVMGFVCGRARCPLRPKLTMTSQVGVDGKIRINTTLARTFEVSE